MIVDRATKPIDLSWAQISAKLIQKAHADIISLPIRIRGEANRIDTRETIISRPANQSITARQRGQHIIAAAAV